jgi:hypothetical protein
VIYFDADHSAVLSAIRRTERENPELARNPVWWGIRQRAEDRFKASLKAGVDL